MASTDDLNFTNGVYRSKESFDIAEAMGENNKVGYVTKSKFYIAVVILLVVIVALLATCGVLFYHLETKGDLAEDGSSSAVVSNQTRRTVEPTSSTEKVTKMTMPSSSTRETTSHNKTTSTISTTDEMSTDNMTSSNMSTPEVTTDSMKTGKTSTGGMSSVETSSTNPVTGKTSTQEGTSVDTSSPGPTSKSTSEATTSTTTSPAASCQSGWITTDASCLFLSTTLLTWKKAKTFCTDAGAHLVEVLTNEKHLLLQTEITNRLTTVIPFWIGLNDLTTEDKFEWSYSLTIMKSSSFSVWAKNQPNNKDGKEHCVLLTKNFLWNDDKCFTERNFICEIDR